MINNPEKFVLHSELKYHKVIKKGETNTTSVPNGTIATIATDIPEDATWLVVMKFNGEILSGSGGTYRTPAGELCVPINRGVTPTEEIFYWRIYGD